MLPTRTFAGIRNGLHVSEMADRGLRRVIGQTLK